MVIRKGKMEKCFPGDDIYYILAAIPWAKEIELTASTG
jgi:hypothetical protein